MSYQFYLFLHIASLIIVFITLGGVVTHFLQGGTKESLQVKKYLSIHHGIALLVVFISGFGMIAKMKYSFASDHWIYIKILCWGLLGGFTGLVYKKVIPAKAAWWMLIVIMLTAVYAVIFKPI